MKRTSRSRRAAALVVVLSVVVILTLIIVSFSVTMRLERQAAYYFSERARANLLTLEGVEMAKIILGGAAGGAKYHVTMPGRVVTVTNGVWTPIDLASGPAAIPGPGLLGPADLNRVSRTGDGLRQIDPAGEPMPTPWIYVYQNGDRTTNASPVITSANPVIGRYAFWVDDESTRVNLNTAHKRQSNGHVLAQAEIQGISDLISEADADEIFRKTKSRPLQSASEIYRITPGLESVLSSNRFHATHYAHSSDLNPWGEPKIVLTTHSNLANGRPFLDILSHPTNDPGGSVTGSIDMSKLSVQLGKITGLLFRTNWPYLPGRSFADKYKPGNTNRIAQLALDIIEYVRAAESTNPAIPMIRIKGNGSFVAATTENEAFLGTTRGPRLTEIGLWVSDATNASGYFEGRLKAELYLPPHYGLSTFTVAGNAIGIQLAGGTGTAGPNAAGQGTVMNQTIAASEVTGDPMTPGSYAVITTPVFALQEATANTNGVHPPIGTNNMRVRVYFTKNNAIWEQGNGTGSPISYPLPATPRPLIDSANLPSLEVDDPRNNKTRLDWILRTGNSFGAANGRWKTAAAVSPQQDRDAGAYSDYSLALPPPKGQPGNEDGRVYSVAELGRIPTGVECATNANAPVPWRTVRLQPTSPTDGELPDWALLDLFAAPVSPSPGTEPLYFPHPIAIAGRLNLNTSVAPFLTSAKSQAIRALTGPGRGTMLTNILTHTLANQGRDLGTTNFYKSIGELAEIRGVSDSGESSEAILRELTRIATVRSDVFRIFCVGQSLHQTPTGALAITATKSVETLVETGKSGGEFWIRAVSWRENPF